MITLTQLGQIAKSIFSDHLVDMPHILAAWAMRDPGEELGDLLKSSGTSTRVFLAALQSFLYRGAPENRYFLTRVVTTEKQRPIAGLHVLRALCKEPSHPVARALSLAGVSLVRLEMNIRARLKESNKPGPGTVAGASATPPILGHFGRDLRLCAANGEFDSVCDRPQDMERLLAVLLRKKKRNAVLTGPPGVGKTALVELFARRVEKGEVPERLRGAALFEVGMGSLVAGAKYRGVFEQRIDGLIKELIARRPAVLFIDEMHLLWGAGRAEGAPLDAANMLKPALAGEKISIVGATTSDEYRKYIARDGAMARRFQEVRVGEPDPASLLTILRSHADELEQFHGLKIDDSLVKTAADLTELHVANRRQPDKGLDILTSAAAFAEMQQRNALDKNDLLRALARSTGRPLDISLFREPGWLKTLEARLNRRVAGQELAVSSVANTLFHRARGFGDPNRNLGTFLFAGGSGVGKTELARSIALEFFGSQKDLFHLDLGEYGQKDAVHKIIGLPYEHGGFAACGLLPRWLRERGAGVLLFDEIEKSHPDVHQLLLGLLDEGRIHSGDGERFDTRQCVVVLTTNAVTRECLAGKPPGFFEPKDATDPKKILLEHFSSEFLARFDDILLFRPLKDDALRKIAELKLEKAKRRLADRNVLLSFDRPRMIDFLLEGFRPNGAGARDLDRILEKKLLQPLATFLLDFDPGKTVEMSLWDDFFIQIHSLTIEKKSGAREKSSLLSSKSGND